MSPHETETMVDLESSSQIELGRAPGSDCETVGSMDDSSVFELPGRRSRSIERELLQNEFPDDL